MIHFVAGEMYELTAMSSPSAILTMDGEASLNQDGVCCLDVSCEPAAFYSVNSNAFVIAGPTGVRLTPAVNRVYHDG
jgi:hypothetical protein